MLPTLVVQEENGGADGRIVVAFRGTQIGKTVDCDADLCADARLWETPGQERCVPPAGMCDKFDDATLDYFPQAVEYTRKVLCIHIFESVLYCIGFSIPFVPGNHLPSYVWVEISRIVFLLTTRC